MHKILILLVGLAFLFGCSQVGGQVANEVGACVDNCQDLCSLAKNNSLDLDGFDEIKLTKKSGSVSVYCSCACN